jgi:hypothetical protein
VILPGASVEKLQSALVAAFDETSLAVLTRTRLDKNLADITSPAPLPEQVFKVIQWADSRGRSMLRRLVDGAVRARPENEALHEFAKEHRWLGLVVKSDIADLSTILGPHWTNADVVAYTSTVFPANLSPAVDVTTLANLSAATVPTDPKDRVLDLAQRASQKITDPALTTWLERFAEPPAKPISSRPPGPTPVPPPPPWPKWVMAGIAAAGTVALGAVVVTKVIHPPANDAGADAHPDVEAPETAAQCIERRVGSSVAPQHAARLGRLLTAKLDDNVSDDDAMTLRGFLATEGSRNMAFECAHRHGLRPMRFLKVPILVPDGSSCVPRIFVEGGCRHESCTAENGSCSLLVYTVDSDGEYHLGMKCGDLTGSTTFSMHSGPSPYLKPVDLKRPRLPFDARPDVHPMGPCSPQTTNAVRRELSDRGAFPWPQRAHVTVQVDTDGRLMTGRAMPERPVRVDGITVTNTIQQRCFAEFDAP